MKRTRIKIFQHSETVEGKTTTRFHVMKKVWSHCNMDVYKTWETVKAFDTIDEALTYAELIKEDGIKWKKVVTYRW